MTGFDFDSPPSPGTNRTAPPTQCDQCGGDRFVLADDTDGYETYVRCTACNAGPQRPPVETNSWWKE